MLRRNPTRIELKINDLEEYDAMKKELEQKKEPKSTALESPTPDSLEARTNLVHKRIGFDPKPLPQPSRLPIHFQC